MPSARRARLFFLATVVGFILLYVYSSSPDHAASDVGGSDRRTASTLRDKSSDSSGGQQALLDPKAGPAAGRVPTDSSLSPDDRAKADDETAARELAQRLKAAEKQAKDLANSKSPLKPDAPGDLVGIGNSAGGQGLGKNANPGLDQVRTTGNPDELERRARIELMIILKRAPVVIFSKTTCPHSAQAKIVLLEKYSIEPAPYVVEIDKHELGHELQELLVVQTGRRTVPNILVNSISVGGGDEIKELDATNSLIRRFQNLGGGRVRISMRSTKES